MPRYLRLAAPLVFVLGSLPLASAQELLESNGRRIATPGAAAVANARRTDSAPAFGVSSATRVTVGPCDATPRNRTHPFESPNCDVLTPPLDAGAAIADAGFPIHLPTGALITSVTVNYFDNTDGSFPGVGLFETDATGTQITVAPLQIGASNAGLLSKTVEVDPPYQVDGSKPLALLAILHVADETHYEGFITANIDYRLQVSPAPGTATFPDAPTDHQFFQYIEALAASGITGGCGGGNYCPDQPVTRGQMAVFLAKALGLHFPN